MPLVKEERLTALMAIHHKGPHIWTADELALLTEVTERSWAHIERVRAEQIAFESVERFQLATQAAMIGTWDFYPTTGDLRWDERCKALFGLPSDAEVSYDAAFLKGLHPGDRERIDQEQGRAVRFIGTLIDITADFDVFFGIERLAAVVMEGQKSTRCIAITVAQNRSIPSMNSSQRSETPEPIGEEEKHASVSVIGRAAARP